MLSKCSAFGKKDDVAQIEKIPACSDNRVSEKALLSVFKVLILLYKNPSYNLFRPWKDLQSCTLDLPCQEKLKHQWQLFMIPKRLPPQYSPSQNIGTKCKRVTNFNLRSTANFHFAWWSRLERKKSNERWVKIHGIWKFWKGQTHE